MKPLVFQPRYKERVWGGRNLASHLSRTLPDGGPIGESWDIVDRAEDQSIVLAGEHAGKSLRALIESNPDAIMGAGWPASRPFPILVKWLDCQDRLSLQVHPPAAIAPELDGEPKTENWYIVHAEPHAALMAGLKAPTSRDEFEAALRGGEAEALVHRMSVQSGESIFIPSGRLHAIDAGNLILEIQQNSDTTYRVFDWGRVGLDGNPRELHIEASLKSIDFEDIAPKTLPAEPGKQLLADSEVFRLRKFDLEQGSDWELSAGQPRILSMVAGEVQDGLSGMRFTVGDNVLLPAASSVALKAIADTRFLVTDQFTGS